MAYSRYYPNGWKNWEAGGTKVSAAALNHMEDGIIAAMEKAGGTMTGRLVVPEFRINDPDSAPALVLMQNGAALVTMGISTNKQTYFAQYGNNASHYEVYILPVTDDNLESNPYYSILTTKNTVTVGQGGTGATSAAGARTNMNIRSGRVSNIAVPAGETVTETVTFATPMPNNSYSVAVTLQGSVNMAAILALATSSYTTEGFSLLMKNTSGSALAGTNHINWIAMAI